MDRHLYEQKDRNAHSSMPLNMLRDLLPAKVLLAAASEAHDEIISKSPGFTIVSDRKMH